MEFVDADPDGNTDENKAHLDDLWLLNTETWAWQEMIPATSGGPPPSRRSTHSTFLVTLPASGSESNDSFGLGVWGGRRLQGVPH